MECKFAFHALPFERLDEPKAAWMMANSRRGPWEMSHITNNALPTSYWEVEGLKSLLSRYLELC